MATVACKIPTSCSGFRVSCCHTVTSSENSTVIVEADAVSVSRITMHEVRTGTDPEVDTGPYRQESENRNRPSISAMVGFVCRQIFSIVISERERT